MKTLFTLVLLALVLMGCTAQDSSDASFGAAERNFAEMMIPHHEQALEMSAIAQGNSQNQEVIALAIAIRDAQAPEFALMSSWPGVDPTVHAGHTMDGMLSNDEIQALRESTGLSFDRLFLQGMIKHHEGAIEMAQEVVESENLEVRELALEIIATQRREINEMRDLLSAL
jgi:uncharacterized protein (DUF305 family)